MNSVERRAEGKSWSDVAERSRRRRAVVVSGLIGAGLILSASTSSVSARPTVIVEQTDGDALAGGGAGATSFGAFATVSGDGRFYVSQGVPAGALADPVSDSRTSTILFTDRETNTTTEITPVPVGLRPGNSIRPVISGDGCTVVAITELALDVFRDDDTDARWDVYRTRLPQCGGELGGWELVSTLADGSGIARDDVSVFDSPAVDRSGTVIAYTHPADHLLDSVAVDADSVSAITVVDLALPIDDPQRAELVAGTPIASPGTTFTHAGIDQPALSGDGRFLVYRSDANSTEAVPTWGDGAIAGGPATRQIFAWDRNEIDPFVAVKLISARPDGTPSVTGASEPSVSRTGRVIAFTSNDVGLVPAVFPVCPEGCPTQVYRVDRDVDDNGWLDEAGRVSITMISAQQGAGSVQDDGAVPPVAGTASSSQPSLNADGQLVAFVTKAPNLQLVEAAGGGESTDGDLLIGDASTGRLRRLTVTSDGVRPAVGSHSRPHLSDTGRSVVFDTLAAAEIAGSRPLNDVPPVGRHAVALSSMPALSLADADFGSVLVGLESDEWFVAVINTGTSSFVPAKVSVTGRQFRINSEGSTCALGVAVPPGGNCTVKVTFVPSVPGPASATLTVAEAGFQAGSVSSKLLGAGGEPTLRTAAGGALGSVVVGAASSEFLFDVQNISLVSTSVKSVTVRGVDAGDFTVSSNNCLNRPLNPRATCSVGVTFVPTASGRRTALIDIVPANGQYTTAVLEGDATYAPTLEFTNREVAAGDDMVLVGHGYPPDTDVTIVFGDGRGDRTLARTTAMGDLLLIVPVPEGEHGGVRTVVVTAAQGSVASAPIEIIPADAASVGLPGFGLAP